MMKPQNRSLSAPNPTQSFCRWSRIGVAFSTMTSLPATTTEVPRIRARQLTVGLRQPFKDCVAHHSHGKYTEIVARKGPNYDDRTPSSRSPIKAAAVLLGIYIAMYLCVAGLLHILGSPEIAAAASMAASPAQPVDGSRRM